MIRLLYPQLDHAATRRGPGFIDALKARAKVYPTHVEIERKDLEELNQLFPVQGARTLAPGEATSASSAPLAPTKVKRPVQVWPMNPFGIAARALKLMRIPEDIGVGDTIARIIGPIGGDAYKTWFKETFGRSCGCVERQADLNLQFPYEKTS